MNPSAVSALDPERFNEHTVALRALARSLVADFQVADDLVQQTMLRALEKPPRFGSSIRGWLRTVLENEARQRHRGENRRRRREASVIPAESPATDELVAELDGHLMLASAVKALDPIHREAILLRFFEDLPPRRIAQRLGLPVKTVESRIQRALAHLRERLDRTHTGRERHWVAVLTPLLRPRFGAEIGVLGIMSIKAMTALIVGVAACVVVTLSWFGESEDASQVPATTALEAQASRSNVPTPSTVDVANAPIRTLDPGAVPEVSTLKSDAKPRGRGMLVDSSGRGLRGIELRARSNTAGGAVVNTLTGTAGEFAIEGDADSYLLEIPDPTYLLLSQSEIQLIDPAAEPDASERRTTGEVTLVAERAGRARGRVVDANGSGVAGVSLGIELPDRIRVLFGERGARGALRNFTANSRADGSFEFPSVPILDGAILEAAKVGFEPGTATLSIADYDNLTIEIRSLVAQKRRLTGIVRGRDSMPLEKAFVAFGDMPARSDTDGRFEFEYDAERPPARILALVEGLHPAILELAALGTAQWPDSVELRIDSQPRQIRGIVLGVDGRPLTQGNVMLARSTRIADWHSGAWVAENLIRGDEFLRIQAPIGADGRFALTGLLDQEYGLRVVDSRRALLVDAGTFHGGDENVVIRLPSDALRARLEGRVIDRRGQPIANAGVRVQCAMLAFEDGKGGKYYDSLVGSSTETDENGRFVLEEVPVEGATIEASHPTLAESEGVPVPDRAFDGVLEILVHRRCDVRVEVDASASFIKFQLLDESGQAISCLRDETTQLTYLTEVALFDGKSETLAASDAAVTLRLFRADGTSVDRPIVLEPEKLNEIR